MGEGEDIGEVMSLLNCILRWEGSLKNCRGNLTCLNAVFLSVRT